MTGQQSGPPPLWEVFAVEDTFGPTSLGGNNRVKRIHFHILGAADSYIDVPIAQFNAANVSALIEDHVAHTVDVMTLKGQAY